MSKTKKVIDGDNQMILEYFDVSDSEEIKLKYENDGRWKDVGIDGNGDIILYEDS